MKTRFKQLMNCIPLINNKIKILISISLLVLAFILCVIRNYSLDSIICLTAMFFSFLGDISLNCMPLEKRPHSLLYAGAGFFMIAHLIYAFSYLVLINNLHNKFYNPGTIIALCFMFLVFTLSIISMKLKKQSLKITTIFVFSSYIVIIAMNFITICSYSWTAKALSFVGALSFLISDLIIGIETVFKVKSDILRKLVWIFYPIGQILILACR